MKTTTPRRSSSIRGRRRSVVASTAVLGHHHTIGQPRHATLRVLWSNLKRLTAESGLWANAGGRFSDLTDAQTWMAQSPRMKPRNSITSQATPTQRPIKFLLLPPPAQTAQLAGQVSSYADKLVSWTLAPLFRGCVELEKLQEIQLGACFSRVVIQFMLQIFIFMSEVPTKWRARRCGAELN